MKGYIIWGIILGYIFIAIHIDFNNSVSTTSCVRKAELQKIFEAMCKVALFFWFNLLPLGITFLNKERVVFFFVCLFFSTNSCLSLIKGRVATQMPKFFRKNMLCLGAQ